MKQFVLFLLLVPVLVKAGSPGGIFNSIPGGITATNPVGFVFPGFNSAAAVNPAALALGKKAVAFQALYSPPLQAGDSTNYFASIAASVKNTGWSLGYTGAGSGSTLTHGMFAGVGFSLKPISLGVGLRSAAFSNGFNPNVDLGAQLQLGGSFTMAAVAYAVDSGLQAGLGLGFGKPRQDNVELGVLMATPGSSDHRVSFGAQLYSGRIGTLFQTHYNMGSRTFTHNLGMLFQVSDKFNLIAELTTPRTMRFGLTFIF